MLTRSSDNSAHTPPSADGLFGSRRFNSVRIAIGSQAYQNQRVHAARNDVTPPPPTGGVFDTSVDADPHAGRVPLPTLILHFAKGKIVERVALAKTPAWAKALVAAAIKISK